MKTITQENIEMLKRLQPKIEAALGEWRFGDMAYSLTKNIMGYYSSTSTVDCKGVRICFFNTSMGHLTTDDELLRVPTLEELIGMIKEVDVIYHGDGYWYVETVYQAKGDGNKAIDLTTAILKALCAQWEV
jgi:hypothetical protein